MNLSSKGEEKYKIFTVNQCGNYSFFTLTINLLCTSYHRSIMICAVTFTQITQKCRRNIYKNIFTDSSKQSVNSTMILGLIFFRQIDTDTLKCSIIQSTRQVKHILINTGNLLDSQRRFVSVRVELSRRRYLKFRKRC